MIKTLFFHAPWCSPCKAMEPDIEGLQGLEKIDIGSEANAAIAREYKIMGTPTTIVLRDGVPVWSRSGTVSRSEIEKAISGAVG